MPLKEQLWKQMDKETFRRVDGAVVKASSRNPNRPWTATEPSPRRRVLIISVLNTVSPRTWKSPQQAMQAVDYQFPIQFKPEAYTLPKMMRELAYLRSRYGKSNPN